MKKNIFSLVLIVIAPLLFACNMMGKPGSENYWGHGFGMGYAMGSFDDRNLMMNRMGINGEQADKISDIDNKYRKLYYENSGDFDKIEALRKDHRKEIDAVLDDSQKNKFNSIYNDRWGGWGRGYGRRHMGDYYGNGYGMGFCSGLYSSGEYMKKGLGLTDDQAKKITDIDSKYRDLYYQNKGNYNRIDELRLEHRKAIEDVLTPDQKKKFTETYDNRWRGWGRGTMMGGPGMMGY